MDWLIGMINKLLLQLSYAADNFHHVINQYLVLYWILYIGIIVLLTGYDLVLFWLRSLFTRLIDFLLKSSKTLQSINFWTQAHYLVDKFLSNRRLGIVQYSYPDRNNFRRYVHSGPVSFLNLFKDLLMTMFTISIKNLIIWAIICFYFNPNWLLHLNQPIAVNWSALFSIIKTIDIPAIYDNLNIIYLLIAGATGYKLFIKAHQKINQEKYEKIIPYLKDLKSSLSEIVYLSSENIDKFYTHLKFLPTDYCSLITNTNKYSLNEAN